MVAKLVAKAPAKRQKQLALSFGDLDAEKQEYVSTITKVKRATKDQWRGMVAVPPGTLLETMLAQFRRKTNIPLEVPFFTFFHYVSAHLVDQNITVEFEGSHVQADFWTIILASSGAGKTWTHSQIKSALGGVIPEVEGTASASAAQFLQELESKNGKGLWVRDEFLQLLKSMEAGGPMAEMKDYLLRIYDNAPITRRTKKDEIHVEHPALSILGFNATESFIANIDGDSLVDGFTQRFGFVLAEADASRPFKDYPVWNINTKNWGAEWKKLIADIRPKYVTSDDAIIKFKRMFSDLIQSEMPESFYRRILWKAHKYALIYHIVRGQAHNPVIEAEDYGWAARALIMHIQDASTILSRTSFGDLEKLMQQAEGAVERMKSKGIEVTPRTLLQRVKGLKNSSTAKFIFEMLQEEKKV
jgi:hypothetical protein